MKCTSLGSTFLLSESVLVLAVGSQGNAWGRLLDF